MRRCSTTCSGKRLTCWQVAAHYLQLVGISTPNDKPKAASTLNDNLHTAKAILQPEWRRNQVSIDIRNEAAHGKPEFQARTSKDITQMIDDVRSFIIKHPA